MSGKFTPGLIINKDRERMLSATLVSGSVVVPSSIDLRSQMLPSSDQGSTSMCAAYALAGWLEFYNWKHTGIAEQVDPFPIYRRSGEILGQQSGGRTLESVLQAAVDLGLIGKDALLNVREVRKHEAQQAMHRYGAILSAFQITDRWSYATKEGWIEAGGSKVGGHAVVLTGYSIPNDFFAIQNSWGEGSGWRGFNRMKGLTFEDQFIYGLVWQ